MPFPITPRYFLRFRNSDVNLTPTFLYFKNAADMTNIVPQPSIVEVPDGAGTYYFDWAFETKSDPDVIFAVDGGPSIPTEEVRYISDTISPRDYFLDEPISQVVTDVWTDEVSYENPESFNSVKKGAFVERIGQTNDNEYGMSLFSAITYARSDVKGAFFEGSPAFPSVNGNDVRQVYENIGIPDEGIMDGGNEPAPVGTLFKNLWTIYDDLIFVENNIGTPRNQIDPMAVSTNIADDIENLRSSLSSEIDIAKTDITGVPPATIHDVADMLTQVIGVPGNPSGSDLGSIVAKLNDIQGAAFDPTMHALSVVAPNLQRLLGLVHENSVLDQAEFDNSNNLVRARVRLFPSKNDATAGTSPIATYLIEASYTLGTNNVETYRMTRSS